ncbi:MAG: Crp/Fnr family transcriptional regulator [Ghiorsea sp.]|nr:Crp/Fnr family transcriptional regulator [Ghiorsea sp.]
MDIDLNWLEENFFKQGLSSTQKLLINQKIEVCEYAKGVVIVAQGNPGSAIYVIHSGSAYIDCNCNGENIRVGTAKPCDLVGEMSFLTEDEASATVTAKEDCIIYKLTRDTFTSFMHEDPDLVYAIFAHLLTHTANVIRHMNEEKAAVQHYMAGNHF